MSVSRVTVFLSAQQLSKVSYSSLKMTEPDRAAWSSIEHLSWRFDSARWCTKAGSVRFDARYFEPSPLLGSINLEPISSQIERLGIDCHLCCWRQQYQVDRELPPHSPKFYIKQLEGRKYACHGSYMTASGVVQHLDDYNFDDTPDKTKHPRVSLNLYNCPLLKVILDRTRSFLDVKSVSVLDMGGLGSG